MDYNYDNPYTSFLMRILLDQSESLMLLLIFTFGLFLPGAEKSSPTFMSFGFLPVASKGAARS
jgi:hypothetical protein